MQPGLFKKAETVKSLAEKNGVTIDYINKLISEGMKVESERSKNTNVQRTIAVQHLSENLGYYKGLAKMEKTFERGASVPNAGYNSYEDYIKDNLGKKTMPFGHGKIAGNDHEILENSFKNAFYNHFFDWEFYFNSSETDENQKEYLEFFKANFEKIKSTPALFKKMWATHIEWSDNYPEGYKFKNFNYDEHGKRVSYDQYKDPADIFWNENHIYLSEPLKRDYRNYKKNYAGRATSFAKGGSLEDNLGNTPAGGALVSVVNGKTVVHNDGSLGGMFQGNRHSENGIKGIVDGSGRVEVEDEEALIIPEAANKPQVNTLNGKSLTNKEVLSHINQAAGGVAIKKEGGVITESGAGNDIKLKGSSVIITRNALLDDTKKDFNGEMLTNKQILSKINQSGGGAAFEEGGNLPAEIYCSGGEFSYGGKMMHAPQIAEDMNNTCGCKHSLATGGNIDENNDPASNNKEGVLVEIQKLDLPDVFKIAFKGKTWRLLKYLQEQATGMSGENDGIGPNAYNPLVRMIGNEDLIKRCVSLLSNSKKRKILKFINDHPQDEPTPPGLIEALQIKPKMEEGGTVAGSGEKIVRDIKKDFIFIASLKDSIEKGTSTSGWDINLFKSSFYNKLAKLHKEGKTENLKTIFDFINETQKVIKLKTPVFTDTHKIWKLRPPDKQPEAPKVDYPVDTPMRMSDIPAALKDFIPPMQLRAVVGNSELWEVIDGLYSIIQKMPHTYQTENIPTDEKIVYLHYFYGGSDWYIVEKDKGDGADKSQTQAFGYTIMNEDYEMAEWGYINIEQLKTLYKGMVELDFYFTPIKFSQLKKKWESEPEEEEEEPKRIEPRDGTFLYGNDFGVPESYSTELITILNQRGFSIVKKKGRSVEILKDQHRFYVNDNGGELNLGDTNTGEHITDIAYVGSHPKDWVATPQQLAAKIEMYFDEFFGTKQSNKPIERPATTPTMKLKLSDTMVTMELDQNKRSGNEEDGQHGIAVVPYIVYVQTPSNRTVQMALPQAAKILENVAKQKGLEVYYGAAGGDEDNPTEEEAIITIVSPDSGVHLQVGSNFWGNELDDDRRNVSGTGAYGDYPYTMELEILDESLIDQVTFNQLKKDKLPFIGGETLKEVILLATEYIKSRNKNLIENASTTEIKSEQPGSDTPGYLNFKKESMENLNEADITGQQNLVEMYQGKKQSIINNAIRTLLKTKGADRNLYSADEIAFLKLYEGAGGLAKQGETGARLFDQFFTPMEICGKMWGFALKYGFKFQGANILEPAVGSGRLLQFIPPDSGADVVAYDVDETAYLLCKVLFPDFDIRHGSFEQMFFKGRRHIGLAGVTEFFDLVITNPPYRDYISEWSPLGEKAATGASTFEMYFIGRGIDVLKPGGLLIMLIPNTFLSNDSKYNDFKNKLMEKADFLDAYRFPNGVFGNTDVGTDLLVLRKK